MSRHEMNHMQEWGSVCGKGVCEGREVCVGRGYETDMCKKKKEVKKKLRRDDGNKVDEWNIGGEPQL